MDGILQRKKKIYIYFRYREKRTDQKKKGRANLLKICNNNNINNNNNKNNKFLKPRINFC